MSASAAQFASSPVNRGAPQMIMSGGYRPSAPMASYAPQQSPVMSYAGPATTSFAAPPVSYTQQQPNYTQSYAAPMSYSQPISYPMGSISMPIHSAPVASSSGHQYVYAPQGANIPIHNKGSPVLMDIGQSGMPMSEEDARMLNLPSGCIWGGASNSYGVPV